MQEWLAEILANPTTTLPNVARALGIGRNQAYDAAKRGDIPCEQFGRRKIVPTSWLKRVLQLEDGDRDGSASNDEAA